jgi:thioredoxin reductase (NADPH)
MVDETREVAVIGGGPAGLTAGIYLCRAKIDAVLIEQQLPGGEAVYAPLIENYPGFPDGIQGAELMERVQAQAKRLGLEVKDFSKVLKLTVEGGEKTVVLESGGISARAVIIATGRSPRKMGIPGEEEFLGRGISTCATCDAPLYRDRVVMVVGGGDAAIEEALHLTRFASLVILVHRRDELRAASYLQERALSEPKLEIMWNSEIAEIKGDQTVKSAVLRNNVTGESTEVAVQGIFFKVGNVPNTEFAAELLELDAAGYIVTDDKMESSMPGVFAAGDVRSNLFKQVILSAAEGALAALSAQRYLEKIGARKAYSGGH